MGTVGRHQLFWRNSALPLWDRKDQGIEEMWQDKTAGRVVSHLSRTGSGIQPLKVTQLSIDPIGHSISLRQLPLMLLIPNCQQQCFITTKCSGANGTGHLHVMWSKQRHKHHQISLPIKNNNNINILSETCIYIIYHNYLNSAHFIRSAASFILTRAWYICSITPHPDPHQLGTSWNRGNDSIGSLLSPRGLPGTTELWKCCLTHGFPGCRNDTNMETHGNVYNASIVYSCL